MTGIDDHRYVVSYIRLFPYALTNIPFCLLLMHLKTKEIIHIVHAQVDEPVFDTGERKGRK